MEHICLCFYISYENMTKILNIARQHCANWNAGNCIGCVFNRRHNKLFVSLDSDLSGKPCVVEKGCDYFEYVVIPGIADKKIKDSAKLLRKT